MDQEQNQTLPIDYDFGGWESDMDKLRHNLTFTPEQILDWLEEANKLYQSIQKQHRAVR